MINIENLICDFTEKNSSQTLTISLAYRTYLKRIVVLTTGEPSQPQVRYFSLLMDHPLSGGTEEMETELFFTSVFGPVYDVKE